MVPERRELHQAQRFRNDSFVIGLRDFLVLGGLLCGFNGATVSGESALSWRRAAGARGPAHSILAGPACAVPAAAPSLLSWGHLPGQPHSCAKQRPLEMQLFETEAPK